MSGTLSRAELLALYDHDERIAATYPDTRREEVGPIVRHLDTVEHSGIVLYSKLDAASADAAIREQVAYFDALRLPFEWKAYSHDQPTDLLQRLSNYGFELDEPETIVVLDLHAVPADTRPTRTSSPNLSVKRIAHPDELLPLASIRREVYGDDATDHLDRLRLEMASEPAYVSVYLVSIDDVPVASGWIRYPATSAFASLWGGSTIPSMRGKGAYTALLAARVGEARERGARYLTVDARSMSRPILERRGFDPLTSATACTWPPRPPAAG